MSDSKPRDQEKTDKKKSPVAQQPVQIDGQKLAALLTDSIRQAAESITALTPQQLEEDVKQIALLLSRQKNGAALLDKVGDLTNNANLLNDLMKIITENEIDLHAVNNADTKLKTKP